MATGFRDEFVKSTNSNSSLKNGRDANYNTFIRYNNINIGEYSDEYSSFLRERIELTNKFCFKIINYWIRVLVNAHNVNGKRSNFNFLFVLSISYCIKPEMTANHWHWDGNNNNNNKEKIIKLLNTKQTFMVHSDKFRLGKKKKIINFKQLTKYHNMSLCPHIPNINECNLCFYEFEIYQKYLNWKTNFKQIFERKYVPLSGSHKIGISSKRNNYFIGIYSYFNQSLCLNSKYKKNGQMYSIDINGNKKLIKRQIAFRKHEIIHIKIDWIQKQLIFHRISLKNRSNNKIIINLTNIKPKKNKNKNKNKYLNINKFEWNISCSICLNDIDSFMWNNKDKDFITYTINQAYIL